MGRKGWVAIALMLGAFWMLYGCATPQTKYEVCETENCGDPNVTVIVGEE